MCNGEGLHLVHREPVRWLQGQLYHGCAAAPLQTLGPRKDVLEVHLLKELVFASECRFSQTKFSLCTKVIQ